MIHPATQFLLERGCPNTAAHCQAVARKAAQLARLFGADEAQAHLAGMLHDISAVIPNEERVATALAWGVDVLPEERAFPMIIHQKLSARMAQRQFGVDDAAVLSAIGCHTTLKPGASELDKVVFVADKIAWDQTGSPPYLAQLQAALEESLDAAALCYLDFLWAQRATLRCVHPWFVAARADLLGSGASKAGHQTPR